jgi:excisionase family DNA binding protein
MIGVSMLTTELIPIREQLERIEKKIDGKFSNRYLSINQVANLTSLSTSTIRRAIKRGQLKCSKKLGKLLFLESDINKWLKG